MPARNRCEQSTELRRGYERGIALAPSAARVLEVQRLYCRAALRTADVWLLDELVTARLAEFARVERAGEAVGEV